MSSFGWKKARSVALSSWEFASSIADLATSAEIDKACTTVRRKGSHLVGIDWNLAERLYIHGELTQDEENVPFVAWPSLGTIAKRIGVSKQGLSNHVVRHKWLERKEKAKRETSELVDAARQQARARDIRKPIEIVDDYISRFDKSVQAGRVRDDDVASFDKACRLRAFLMGEADSRQEQKVTLTLEAMQSRHREARTRALTIDAVTCGVLSEGERTAESPDSGEPQGAYPGDKVA